MFMQDILRIIRLIVNVFAVLETDPSAIQDEEALATLIVQKARELDAPKADPKPSSDTELPY